MTTPSTTHFHSLTRIEKATHNEPSRYPLDCVHVMTKDKDTVYLTATDGIQMSIVPSQGKTEKTVIAPPGAFPTTAKSGKVQCDREWRNVKQHHSVPVVETSRFPSCAKELPDFNEEGSNPRVVSFNAKQLMKSMSALVEHGSNDDIISLIIGTNTIKVGINTKLGFGVIMPFSPAWRTGSTEESLEYDQISEYQAKRDEYVKAWESRGEIK